MYIKVIVVLVLTVLVVFLLYPSSLRFLKTFFLIASVTPYEKEVTDAPAILILGDSTGYGTGADKSTDSIAGRIGRDSPSYSIKNNSKNGRTIGGLVSVAETLEGDYALILLQIGGNDILQKRSKEEVKKELITIIGSLTKRTEHIVMMSAGNVGGAPVFSGAEAQVYEELTREFRAMFLDVAEGTPLTYVDLFKEPAEDQFIDDPDTYLSIDGLHPSSTGYGLWYESLYPVLREKL